MDVLAGALDGLAREVAAQGVGCRPLVVQHGQGHLDVLLDEPTLPAVEGWRSQADGAIWSLEDPPATTGLSLAATPLLVSLGRPDDGGQLYLDLEAAQLVSLTGDLGVAHDLANTLVAELAHSAFAANVQMVLVGDLRTELTDLDGVRTCTDWSGVAADLTAWGTQSGAALEDNGWPSTFAGRGHDADHDALIPFVVVATAAPPDEEVLEQLVANRAAAAVVIVGEPVTGATVVDCQPHRLSLPHLGLDCVPQTLTADQVADVAGILRQADDHDTGSGTHRPGPAERPEPAAPGDAAGDDTSGGGGPPAAGAPGQEDGGVYEDPSFEVLVRYLGDITVETARADARPLTPKETALVAYIALHGPVSTDRLVEALWVNMISSMPRKRLANTVTKCRAALGARHMPAIRSGRYSTGPEVGTDLELFERRVEAAAAMPPAEAVPTLRGALDLVTGPVFHYSTVNRDSYTWVSVENWISIWELKITATAERFARLCLEIDDPAQAAEVAERILRIVPTHAGVTESLIEAHAANGDRLAIERVYQAHLAALDQLNLDTVADSTAATYQRLRSG